MKKRLLFSILACSLFAGSLMAQYADFPFTSNVKDANGVINSIASPTGITFVQDSMRGMVAQFAPNDSAYVTLDNSIYNMSTLSYNIWFKWQESVPTWWERIFDFGTNSTTPNLGNHDVMFVTAYQNNILAWHFHPVSWTNGSDTVLWGDTIQLGKWYMLTMVQTTDSAWLYENAKLMDKKATGVAPSALSFASGNCYLGKSNWPDPYFPGRFSDFTVWKKALTPAEIKAMYTFPSVGTSIQAPSVLNAKIYSYDRTLKIMLPGGINTASVKIYNIQGIQVYQKSELSSLTEINDLSPGIYIVRVISSNGVATQKVVIR